MSGSTKGVTIVAKLLGGRQIEVESEEIKKSLQGVADTTTASDEKAVASAESRAGSFELFRAREKKALKDSEEAHKKHGSALENILGISKTQVAGLALGGGIYESIKEGMKISALERQIEGVGHLHGGAMAKIAKSTERSALAGGFSQAQQLEGIQAFIGETGNATAAIKANIDATNLARGAGLGYSQTQKMIQMGLTGSTGRLAKYLGIIQPVTRYMTALKEQEYASGKRVEATDAEKKHAELLDKEATRREVLGRIEAKYAGAQQRYAKTAAGAWSNLKNSISLLEDKIGKALLPDLTKVAKVLISVVTWVLKTKWALVGLGVLLGAMGLADVIDKFSKLGKLTVIWTKAQWLLNAAMDANGLTLIVLGVAALVAIVTVAYLKVGWFREGVQAAFHWIEGAPKAVFGWLKAHWPLLAGVLFGPFGLAVGEIITHWDSVVGFVERLPGRLKGAGAHIWDFIKEGFRGAIDWVLSGWNKLHFKVPGIHIGPVGFGGMTIGLPHIPLLGEGGTVWQGGMAIVGERGPELLSLPPAARVDPLLPDGRPPYQPGTYRTNSRGDIIIISQLDGKQVGRAVLTGFGDEEARRG